MILPIFAVALASLLAAPAGAVAYGYRAPLRNMWIPELFLAAVVMRDYRKRGSFWFMLYHGLWLVWRRPPGDSWNQKLLGQLGLTTFEVRQIRGLYAGLEPEIGRFLATACCVEIVRNLKAREKARAERSKGRRVKLEG